MATTLQTHCFTITKTSDTGFQTAEEPGVWFNLSKYTKPAPVIPPIGARVDATVDPRGFVLAIEPVKQNGVAAETGTVLTPSASTDQALRLAVLEIAARFLATPPDAKSGVVVSVAERWEEWVGR